jgi:hypothetical protein
MTLYHLPSSVLSSLTCATTKRDIGELEFQKPVAEQPEGTQPTDPTGRSKAKRTCRSHQRPQVLQLMTWSFANLDEITNGCLWQTVR